MTELEFERNYKNLSEAFEAFRSPIRKQMVAQRVMDLSERFWRALVERMIVSGNPRMDIEEACRGERMARFNADRVKQEISAIEAVSERMTAEGFEKTLKSFGATNLAEAVFGKNRV